MWARGSSVPALPQITLALGMIALTDGWGWKEEEAGIRHNLHDVTLLSDNIAYAVGEGDTIARTNDAGRSWFVTDSGLNNLPDCDLSDPSCVKDPAWDNYVAYSWHAVQFLGFPTGWIAGSHGTLLKTDDGGNSWAAQDLGLPQTVVLRAVAIVGELSVYAAGSEGTIVHTADGGATWVKQ
ncbi:hypothetical protein CYMTET_6046, partial [Cymbomonas tetramitiformis]